ncbi:uncharacterized protein LOC142521234 [Primulina tabacum]|uniref:uncharacterized protein LOC142521234 n=1 Tax=Primulina tabacum TaxID=48773 RepID=UPI003F5A674E
MAQHSCCNKQMVKRGLWSPEEDEKLINYITTHGHVCWRSVPEFAGLQRCGKSCRLRWINYLRPDLKRGSFTRREASIVIELHRTLGNRWSQIAKHLPGRTDNEVKNFWNSSIKKKFIAQQNQIFHAADMVSPATFSPVLENPCGGDFSENLYLMNVNNNPNPNSEIDPICNRLIPSPPILQGFCPADDLGFDSTMSYNEKLSPFPPAPMDSVISQQLFSWPMASNFESFRQNHHQVLNQDDTFMLSTFENPSTELLDGNKFFSPNERLQDYVQDLPMADPIFPKFDGTEFGIPFSSAVQEQVFGPVSEGVYECDMNAAPLRHIDYVEPLRGAFTSSTQSSTVSDIASPPAFDDLLPPLPCSSPFHVSPSATAFLSSWDEISSIYE